MSITSDLKVLNVLKEVEKARGTILENRALMQKLIDRVPSNVLRNYMGLKDYKKYLALKCETNRAFAVLKL